MGRIRKNAAPLPPKDPLLPPVRSFQKVFYLVPEGDLLGPQKVFYLVPTQKWAA